MADRDVRIEDFADTFAFDTPKRMQLDSIEFIVKSLPKEIDPREGIIGLDIQAALTSISQSIVLANIACNEANPPSSMQPGYSNGEVVFRCYHVPPHEFRIKV